MLNRLRRILKGLERFLRLQQEDLDLEGTKLLLRGLMQDCDPDGKAILLAAYTHIALPELVTPHGTVRFWEGNNLNWVTDSELWAVFDFADHPHPIPGNRDDPFFEVLKDSNVVIEECRISFMMVALDEPNVIVCRTSQEWLLAIQDRRRIPGDEYKVVRTQKSGLFNTLRQLATATPDIRGQLLDL